MKAAHPYGDDAYLNPHLGHFGVGSGQAKPVAGLCLEGAKSLPRGGPFPFLPIAVVPATGKPDKLADPSAASPARTVSTMTEDLQEEIFMPAFTKLYQVRNDTMVPPALHCYVSFRF